MEKPALIVTLHAGVRCAQRGIRKKSTDKLAHITVILNPDDQVVITAYHKR